MTTYSAITSGQIDAESYIDTVLAGQWTNNVLAIQEDDPTAPNVVGANLVLISTTSISSQATVDFTSLDSTYALYMFELIDVLPATDAVALHMLVSQSGSFLTGSYNYKHTNKRLSTTLANDEDGNNGYSLINLQNTANSSIGNANPEGIVGRVFLHQLAGSKYCKLDWVVQYTDSSGFGWGGWGSGMNYSSPASAYDGIRFKFNSGNLASGVIKKYGIK